jgi:hypothetical protein|tara:strand:+ start:78 stop:548 length:471 start_codon:yes stop_codon:yes gene_type:complete
MAYALFNKGCEGDGISLLKIAVDDDHLNSFLDKDHYKILEITDDQLARIRKETAFFGFQGDTVVEDTDSENPREVVDAADYAEQKSAKLAQFQLRVDKYLTIPAEWKTKLINYITALNNMPDPDASEYPLATFNSYVDSQGIAIIFETGSGGEIPI